MKHLLPFSLFLVLQATVLAQNIQISYTQSDALFACGADTFFVEIKNNHSSALQNGLLTVALPTGITYLPGSMTGASEQNTGNLSAPVFALPAVPSGGTALLSLTLTASCAAADALDAGQLFLANLSVSSPLGSAQVSTTSIPVETAAAVIESVTPPTVAGQAGDTLQRSICVRNTRLGKIGHLLFQDSHLQGMEMFVSGANSPANTPTLFSAQFDGSHFSGTGNGDAWLDLNEQFCFTENIIVTSCGSPSFTSPTLLRAGWGCSGSNWCRYDSTLAFVQVLPSTKVPELIFEQIWASPFDHCGKTPVVMGFNIRNIGKAPAKDMLTEIATDGGIVGVGIKPGTLRWVSHGTTALIAPNLSSPYYMDKCEVNAIAGTTFVVPEIGAQDSIKILFDVLSCMDSCDQALPAFRVNYFFKKDCPANSFVSGAAKIEPEKRYEWSARLEADIGMCLDSGKTYPFRHVFTGRYLREDGFIHLRLKLPLGLSFDDSCGTGLNGQPALLFERIHLPTGGEEVHLAWAAGLSTDYIEFHYCLRYLCHMDMDCKDPIIVAGTTNINDEFCCLLEIETIGSWSKNIDDDASCAIDNCGKYLISVDPVCKDLLPGGGGGGGGGISSDLKYWWDAYRVNIGYKDDDDDRKADLPLAAASDGARRDRFLPGDTLRVAFGGVVDGPGLLTSIPRTIWHEVVGSDMKLNGNDTFPTQAAQHDFANQEKFKLLRFSLKVRYNDGTVAFVENPEISQTTIGLQYYQIALANTFPTAIIDDFTSLRYFFLYDFVLLASQGHLPKPYIANGDSIFIVTDFKLDFNARPSSTNAPDPPLIGFRTASGFGGGEVRLFGTALQTAAILRLEKDRFAEHPQHPPLQQLWRNQKIPLLHAHCAGEPLPL